MKERLLEMIVQELGEANKDLTNITTSPLPENEKIFATIDFLYKTFIQSTMKITTIQHKNKESKEDNKNLTYIIKNNDLEKITAATKEGIKM